VGPRRWDCAPVYKPSVGDQLKSRERKGRAPLEHYNMAPASSVDMKRGAEGKETEKEKGKDAGQLAGTASNQNQPPSDAESTADMFSIVLTPAQWRKLVILAFGSLVNNITYSLLAPFFPSIARERGVSEIHVGLVFGREETRTRVYQRR